jgi:hypothetical protein
MTIDEAIKIVAHKALVDNTPTSACAFQPLTLDEVVASAQVLGRASDMEVPPYYIDADNYIIDVAYADLGYRAMYEVGPATEPIMWAN